MRKLLLLTGALAALAAGSAQANTLTDPTGDFLAGVTPETDLDLTNISVIWDGALQNFLVSATLAGQIDPTTPGNFVLGVNTGTGVSHPFGALGQPNVQFNQAFVLQKSGAINNAAIAVSLTGSGFSLLVPLSILPATIPGFAPQSFGFNIWSRGAGNQIADFAPENQMLTAGVPEPASWALMIGGFGMAGAMLRRRQVNDRNRVRA